MSTASSPHLALPTTVLMSILVHADILNMPEDVTPVPEDVETLQNYIQDRRVIGVSTSYCRTLSLRVLFRFAWILANCLGLSHHSLPVGTLAWPQKRLPYTRTFMHPETLQTD